MRRGRFEPNFEQVYFEAKNNRVEERLEDELASFAELLRQHYEFKLFLEDPRISAQYKKKCLMEICPRNLTPNFFSVIDMLIDNGREELIEPLSRNLSKQLFRDKGIFFGYVKSVNQLSDSIKKRLSEVMNRIKGSTVKLRYGIDPGLLGGLVVEFINGEVWDVSLRRKLADLKHAITG